MSKARLFVDSAGIVVDRAAALSGPSGAEAVAAAKKISDRMDQAPMKNITGVPEVEPEKAESVVSQALSTSVARTQLDFGGLNKRVDSLDNRLHDVESLLKTMESGNRSSAADTAIGLNQISKQINTILSWITAQRGEVIVAEPKVPAKEIAPTDPEIDDDFEGDFFSGSSHLIDLSPTRSREPSMLGLKADAVEMSLSKRAPTLALIASATTGSKRDTASKGKQRVVDMFAGTI
jgi:hypothetical protein